MQPSFTCIVPAKEQTNDQQSRCKYERRLRLTDDLVEQVQHFASTVTAVVIHPAQLKDAEGREEAESAKELHTSFARVEHWLAILRLEKLGELRIPQNEHLDPMRQEAYEVDHVPRMRNEHPKLPRS